MSVLVANPCTSLASPIIYIADAVSDISFIRQGKKGDVVFVKPLDGYQVWAFSEEIPDGYVEGINYIVAKPCGYWVLIGLTGAGGRSGVYSVTDYGATGDGETDDSTAFMLAIASVPEGTQIYIPEGTYILDGVIVNRNVGFKAHHGAILKHKDGAANHMIRYTVACKTKIEGGIWDGNSAGQVKATSFAGQFSLLYSFSDGMQIRDCLFRDFMFAAILDFQTQGDFDIEHCRFENGYSLLDTDTLANAAVRFAPTGGAPHVTVRKCWFENDSAPASGSKACGGVIFANGGGAYNSVTIDDCDFVRVGDDAIVGPAHYGIAAIDLYESAWNATVTNNRVNTYYVGLKLQNTENLVCTGNFIRTTAASGIDYCPGERLQANEFRTAKITDNTIDALGLTGSSVGIYIRAGFSGGWKDVIIRGNTVKEGAADYAIRVEGAVDNTAANEGFGPVLIQGNQLWSTAANGIDFQTTQGDFKLVSNYINATGGNGITATSANSASTFTVTDNTIVCNTSGFRPVRLFGVKSAVVCDNTLTPFLNQVALEIDGDGSGNPVEVLTERGNILLNGGTKSIDYSDVRKVVTQQRVVAQQVAVIQNDGVLETDLCALTIPKYTLNENGQSIQFEAHGLIDGTVNNKQIKVYLGATMLYDSTSFACASDSAFVIRGSIPRGNVSAQNTVVEFRTGITTTALAAQYLNCSETLTDDLVFKITGLGGASAEVSLSFVKLEFKETV